MARKIAIITIDTVGRDQGKIFILREMPASQAERWAFRALSALAASGVELPDDIANAGLAGVARIGLQAFGGISWEKAEPLISEMFDCVTIQPGQNPAVVRALIEDDIEEVTTRIKIRMELFKLHMDFFKAAAPSIQGSAAATPTV